MPKKSRKEKSWHLTLGIQKDMWDRLLLAALPVKVAGGEFDLLHDMGAAAQRLDLKGRVKGLLEDRHPPEVVRKAQDRAIALWRERRGQVKEVMRDMVRVQGTWRLQIEQEGSAFYYARQRVGLQARVSVVAEGQAHLVRNNLEFPFTLQKFASASLALTDIHFDRDQQALVGTLGGLMVDLGDNVLYQVMGRAAEVGLEKQFLSVNPFKMLGRDQLESFVSPAAESIRLHMGVEDLDLEVDEETVTLKVRFGFTQKQIEEKEA